MALVAYEYSDESENETEDSITINRNINLNLEINGMPYDNTTILEDEVEQTTIIKRSHSELDERLSDDEQDSVPVSFSNLPKPNYHAFNFDASKIKNCKLNSLSKLLPTVSENKSSDELKKKNVVILKKESGLLAMLPSPTDQLTFTSQTPTSSESLKKLVPDSVKKKEISRNEKIVSSSKNKMNDADEIGVDFFSLSKVDMLEDCVEPVDIGILDTEIKNSINCYKMNEPCELSTPRNLQYNETDVTVRQVEECNHEENDFSKDQPCLNLDNDAIQKLCGRKRNGQTLEDIELIDICEDKILAESKKLLAKHLTEEVTYHSSQKKFAGPSSQEKRKHQITYLAYQAKERELELKNQWANNRFTKKQTQSKYGF